ncbi:MAG TPA: cytochrome b [Gammaproteobacteria bacterium]|nr:cytochrome b [Gammaproteobacteria bacterium]
MLRNTPDNWGWVAIAFHWMVAAAVIGLFFLGWWMVDLNYYSPWYVRAPDIHKSVGILLFGLVALRLVWRLVNVRPRPEPGPAWEHLLAEAVHWLIYLLMFAILATGYLIPTAQGAPISVFGWFEVPAWVTGIQNQEDIAGDLHRWLAWSLMALVAIHAAGALQQHFIKRNRTLKRMLGIRR